MIHPNLSVLRLSQIQSSHGLFRTVFLLSICWVSAASFLDFCSLVCLLTANIMTKKPQCNSGRTFLPASQEFLLPCASTVRFTAVTPLEDGAGLMNHLRDKVQRTSCNPTYTKAYTPIWCGSACNRGHAGDAASAQPTVDPKRNLWWYGWK